MRWFVNDPPRWLARALAIVNGNAPVEIESTIYPTADVIQGGWGDITWTYQFMSGAVGSVTQAAIVDADVNLNRIVRCSYNNGDSVASTPTLEVLFSNSSFGVVVHRGTAAAGAVVDSRTIVGDTFLVVPAGLTLRATIPPATTTAPTWTFHIGTAPVGTKLV